MQLSFISCLSPSQRTKNRTFQSFTLIELLVVIAILAILAVAVVLVLNPVELIKESRDTTRIEDLTIINKALSLIQVDQPNASFGSSTTVYVSIPWTTTSTNCSNLGLPTLPSGYAYGCAPTSTYQMTDGTGWIPVNFASFSAGAPFSKLPADPTNTTSTGLYYTYIPGGSWEMTALMESQKRKMGGDKDATSQDGGQYPEMYETGSALKYTPITRDPTLVGYWSFEEGSGNATSTDYSGNNNNGTWYGTSTHYGTGKVGSWAGSFNGSSDYVGVSTESDFDFVGSSFSLAGWVKTNTTSTYQRLFNKYGASYTYTTWITSNSGKLEFRWATPTQNSVLSTFGLSPNAWYHVVFVRNDSANLNSIYINGSFNNSASYSGTVIENDEDFALGRTHEAGGVSYLNGYLDAARVYDRALSAAEIQALYNATR